MFYPTALTAARTLASQLARPMPNLRESKDAVSYSGVFNRLSDAFSGFPGDSAYRIRKVLRYLAQYDDDVAGTLRDQQILVNPGFKLEFAKTNKRTEAQARKEIEVWEKRVFQGGFNALINNQVREVFVTGASSVEWVPEKNRKGVKAAVPVKAEDISIRIEDDGNVYEQVGIGPEAIELHPLTYRYIPVQTEGSSPYGIPQILPAMFGLDRKFALLDAEKRVINLMAHSALIKGTIPKPSPRELGLNSVSDPGYQDKLAAYVNQVADLLMQGSENGLYLGLETDGGKMQIDAVPLNQTGAGTKDIVAGNQKRVWSALGSPGYLRGELDTAAFAISRIVQPMVHALAEHTRLPIALQLEYGANLHLRLCGINATCWLHFDKPADAFRKENAEAEKTEMETDALGKKLFGASYYSRAARRWDIVESDAAQAPDSWKTPEPEDDDVDDGNGDDPPDEEVEEEAE